MATLSTSEIEQLFEQTLIGSYDGDEAWAAIRLLHGHANQKIFAFASGWAVSTDPLKRARAADVLAQLRASPDGFAPGIFADESCLVLGKMLAVEQNPEVVHSAVSALGHLRSAEAIPLILPWTAHADKNVRFAASCALGSYPNDPRSVLALIGLTDDPDAEVRDWAVFGLGVQGDEDSVEIRETLFRCLEDTSESVREEAAVGLSKRQDSRVIPAILKMLEEDDHSISVRVLEAADALLGRATDAPQWSVAEYKSALKE